MDANNQIQSLKSQIENMNLQIDNLQNQNNIIYLIVSYYSFYIFLILIT